MHILSIILHYYRRWKNKYQGKERNFKEVLKEVLSNATSLKYYPAITEREILKRGGILEEKYYHT